MQHGGAPVPGGPPRPQGMQSRIDPSQIPRPVAAHQGPEPIVFHTRLGGAHQNPPPSTSRYIVRDCGSASPRLLRATLNTVPFSPELLNSSGMPLAVVVQPMALPDPADDPVAVVDLGDLGPIRCSRCKAYINAFVRWTDGGKAFACNFCGGHNPCPEPYFCYLGPDGRRRDADERPELSRGTYEVVATRDYMVRPPMPVTHVFLVDVSGPALGSGATAAACQCIEQVLDSIQGGDNALVGVATFDSSVHFYQVAAGQQQPAMMVMADTADVYSPLPAAMLSRLADCKEQLVDLLHSIPGMFSSAAHGPESCGSAAIEACIELLKPVGGRIHAFLATLPNSGVRSLKIRDHAALVNEKDKQQHLVPQDNTFYTVAAGAADYQVSVDLFLLVQSYADVATLGVLPSTTGGSVYHYCPFTPQLDQDQLLNDLKWNVARPQGLEAILRVRASTGLDVESYVGAFYKPPNSPTDVYLPAVDSDKALVARINITEKLTNGSECYLQSALLYTSTDGARRIRVSTLALPVSDAMGSVFKGADLDAQLSVLARQVATTLPGGTFAAAKDAVMSRSIATLAAYRKFCATSSSAVQLILPEALKLLPLYALALLKSAALRPDVRADDRSLWLGSAISLGAGRVMGLLHGRLFPLHRLVEVGLAPDGGLPDPMALSSEGLEAGGVYVLENGADLLLYVDRDAAPQLVQELFGAANTDELSRAPAPLTLPPRDAPAARLLSDLLTRLRLERCAYMRLRAVRKGDPLEASFVNALLEDRSPSGMSYVEFLCHIHRQIQNKMG
ncbi:MAG: Sec23/Sec24 trunk domain-containing protein [Monoraphidium minutum]|nr:MAG: Sec23/Sec24 trunk domain-containing protein [Monoraphidium minutum]